MGLYSGFHLHLRKYPRKPTFPHGQSLTYHSAGYYRNWHLLRNIRKCEAAPGERPWKRAYIALGCDHGRRAVWARELGMRT
jgi:hypothetical protein